MWVAVCNGCHVSLAADARAAMAMAMSRRAALLLLIPAAGMGDKLPAALDALLSSKETPPPSPPVLPWPLDGSAPWDQAKVEPLGGASPMKGAAKQQQQHPPLGTFEPSRPNVEDTFAREERRGDWPPPSAAKPSAASNRIRSQAAAVASGAVDVPSTCRPARVSNLAVVTLITSNEGYPAGALAISASLEVFDSALRRIALVTPAVASGIRDLLHSAAWEVREVPELRCNQKLGEHVTSDRYDLGAEYQAKKAKWLATCTKFHVWNLTFLQKAIFLDADTLVMRPIDTLADHPPDFAAAPDTFPADQFNSGVMVIKPSKSTFKELKRWNEVNGTAEGGDQCLLNEFFSEWFYGAWDDPVAGRLPWIMNVAAAHHEAFRTLARMQSRDEPVITHFVGGESKPWIFMVLQFQGMEEQIPPAVRRLMHAWNQMYWLAKTNRICAGQLSDNERSQARALLTEV